MFNNFSGVYHVSAGHPKHEYTTGYAFNEILKFFIAKDYKGKINLINKMNLHFIRLFIELFY
jgi:hypothetical protein